MEIRDRERPEGQWVVRWAFGLAFLSLLVPAVCQATNGLNLIGSGGISSALAGADTAVATDYSAMNTNPAGLTQISGAETGVTLGAILPSLHFRSVSPQNNKDAENDPIVIGSAGYVRHLAGTPVTLGVGFFTVGGLASDFRDLNTGLGNQDKRGAFVRHYKFTPSIAYQVTDKLSLGTALAVSYADISLTLFPNTPGGFETTGKCNRANGLALPASCAYAVTFVPKFGAMYKLTDTITLGLAYTMKAQLPFDNGRLALNTGPPPFGLGIVTYDAHAQGFKWPEDLSAGIAIRPRSDLLIAAKFEWINWDAAFNNVTITLTNPSTPGAPTPPINLPFNWRNQYVAAVGAAYDVNDQLNVRGGYNYGNNPVPKSTLDPAFATIVEHHLVAGLQYLFTQALSLEGSFTYAFKNQRTFDSSTFGSNATIQVGGIEFLFTLIYRS